MTGRALLLAAALAVACSDGVVDAEGRGTLAGAVSVGPFCPVERPGEPCPPPPGTFERMRVVVRRGRIVARVGVGDDGRYRVELAAGSYLAALEHDLGPNPVARFVSIRVEPGETTTVDFSVDTGIRAPAP